jgi:uncharacterized protein (DUF1778 family)
MAARNLTKLKNYNNWLYSRNDEKVFFNALLNPPAPNEKLKQVMKRHGAFKPKT